MIKIFLLFVIIFVSGCFTSNENEISKPQLGEIDIKYYSNKSVNSLEVPPDLTSPDYQNSFRLSEFVKDLKEKNVNLSDTNNENVRIFSDLNDIQVNSDGYRKWITVNQGPEIAWDLVREFFKLEGFKIEKTNKKLGLMETDFLENRPDIPEQSLGIIRSMIRKATSQSYILPILDKYRARIEPTKDRTKSNIFITLQSIEEVLTNSGKEDENTIWQSKPKDEAIETEMLLRLMAFISGDKAGSIEKIIQAKKTNNIKAVVGDSINGYAKISFNLNLLETWDNFSWAIDQLQIDIDDKDLKERAFYLNAARTSDKGIFTKLFGDDAVKKTYQISFKEISSNKTEIYFNDISEGNESETKEYSYDLFKSIALQFK